MNILLNQIHYQVNVTQIIFDFPEGNMFWARISAIFPMFNLISKAKSKEKLLLILKEYIEKIWIFLLKINGFLYNFYYVFGLLLFIVHMLKKNIENIYINIFMYLLFLFYHFIFIIKLFRVKILKK